MNCEFELIHELLAFLTVLQLLSTPRTKIAVCIVIPLSSGTWRNALKIVAKYVSY